MDAYHPLGDLRWQPSYIFVHLPSFLYLLSFKPLIFNYHCPLLYLSPPSLLGAIAWAVFPFS